MSHRIGPTLPPHLLKKYEDPSSDEEDDAYGPALPPHLVKSVNNKEEKLPSSTGEQDEHCKQTSDSSSSEDDKVVGPLPVDQCDNSYSSATELEKRSLKMKRKLLGLDNEGASKEPKREDWMIELPELQTKNFGLGPRSFNRTEKPECTGRDQWTTTPNSKGNTPKEKTDNDQELRNQYLEHKRNEKLEEIVDQHDKTKRSKSLLSVHQKELKRRMKEEGSKPKERKPFDRDEDLKVNKLDDAKRKALIKRSQELNSKFKIGNQKFL